jgi:hypothetical protein
MWHGTAVREKVDLSGRYVETRRILTTQEGITANQNLFYNLINILQTDKSLANANTAQGYLWQDVPAKRVLDFVKDYKNHDDSVDTQMPFMHRFVKHIEEKDNIGFWDVALVSLETIENKNQLFVLPTESSLSVNLPRRAMGKPTSDGKGVEVSSRRRMASQGIERIGLTDDQIEKAKKLIGLTDGRAATAKNSKGTVKNIDQAYRLHRSKPLLVLFLANLEGADGNLIYPHAPIYGISFPYINRDYDYEGEEYVANAQWIRENFGASEDDDEAEYVGE